MSYQSRWAAPKGPDAAQKAAQRAARFSAAPSSARARGTNGSSSSSSQKSTAQELDLLLSPSRGELAHEKSLRDPAVQAEYHIHLQNKLGSYTSRYSMDEAWAAGKLREGLLAAGRADDFAVQVYQEAIDLGCYARHAPTLTTALPSLLHLYAQSTSSVQSSMAQLSVKEQPARTTGPAFYASLHLLHLLSSTLPGSRARFWDAYRDMTLKPGAADLYAKRQHVHVAADHPHVQLATRAFAFLHRRDWVGFRCVLNNSAIDARQKLLLRGLLESQVRDATWDVLVASYQLLPAPWLQTQLQLDQDAWEPYLTQRERREVDGVVQIKVKK